MKKNLRKLSALLLALVMVLGMTGMAFADADNVYEGSNNTLATSMAGTASIPLNKTVVIFNTDDGTEVREPDIVFSYSVAKVDSTADEAARLTGTITDDQNVTVTVYNGVVTGGAISNPSNITYVNTNTVVATTKGFEDEKSTSISVDPTKFPHAGVYRYVITESSDVTLASVGMEAHTAAYDSTRYLDVYIYNPDYDAITNTSGHQTLWMGGAVIFKSTSTDDSSPANTASDAITATTDKTTGFEPGNNTPGSGANDYTNDETVDRYFTYNLDVTKKITGTLADKNHDFPFQISFTGALAHAVTVDVTNSSASPANTTLSISTTPATDAADLRNDETYSVTGLPKGTTVTVTEYNDTVDTYKLTTSFDGTTSTATKSNAAEGTTLATATGETGVLINSGDASNVKADKKTVLTFTNNLETISPTGVVLRVAPYMAILCGGIVLLALTKKRKADEEA